MGLPPDWRNPEWHIKDKVHNWRNYVSEEIENMWQTFSDEQKKALAECFDSAADREEWD